MIDVSVIVPIFNSEKWLKKCVESLLSQTWKNLEIVLVNDGSTDSSAKICEYYIGQDERFTYVNQSNKGLSGARNAGLEVASGDYIYFLDSDDYLCERMVEICINTARRTKCEVITFDSALNSESNRYCRDLPPNKVLGCNEVLSLNIEKNQFCPVVWLYMYKRSFLLKENLKFFSVKYYEDNLFTYKILASTGSCCYIPRKLHNHVFHDESITGRSLTSQNIECLIIVLKEMIDLHFKLGSPKEHYKLLRLYAWLPFRVALDNKIFDYNITRDYLKVLLKHPKLMSISLLKSIVKFVFRLGRPVQTRL